MRFSRTSIIHAVVPLAAALAGCSLAIDLVALSAGEPERADGEADDARTADGSPVIDNGDGASETPDALPLPPPPPCNSSVRTVGPQVGAMVSLAAAGAEWASTNNVLAVDSTGARAVLATGGRSRVLRVQRFGFAIPLSATIRGVEVHIRGMKTTYEQDVREDVIQLVVNDNLVGTNLASADWDNWYLTRDYGGTTNLWGNALTPALVNSDQFGAGLVVKSSGVGTADVDAIRMTITYCE